MSTETPETVRADAHPLSASEYESRLREELRGRRLVLEVGLSERRLRELRLLVAGIAREARDPAARLCARYPAIYATYLVSEGVYNYDGGTFWPHVITPLRDQNNDPGYRFLRALEELGLPTFDRLVTRDKAHPYLSRILAHGGIPRSCAPGFLRFLVHQARRTPTDAGELLAAWRTQRTRLDMVHKPTARFLLYGGDPATDLLDRCLDLIERSSRGEATEGHDVGLPGYLVEAFRSLSPEERRRGRVGRGGLPRPVVALDPYDGLGPTLLLPALPGDLPAATWRVHDGQTTRELGAGTLVDTSVRLTPATTWEAELATHEGEPRKHTFEGLDRLPALFFDPATGRLVRDPAVLALDGVWVLVPRAWSLTPRGPGGEPRELALIETLPAPAGAWDGYLLLHLDLEGARQLLLEDLTGSAAKHAVAVVPARARSRLAGQVVDGVTTAAGEPVYATPPRVLIPAGVGLAAEDWNVRLRGRGVERTFADPVGVRAGVIELGQCVPGDQPGCYQLQVRGPLGSDLKERFAIVPGLRVLRPAAVVLPSDASPAVTLEARVPLQAEASPAATAISVELPSSADSVVCAAPQPSGGLLELRVHVPRLLWTVTHDTKPAVAPSDHVLRIGAEEFEDELADVLTVRAGVPDVALQLSLRRGRQVVQESPESSTAGADGRWSFNLGPFADTIRASEAPLLSLYLRVGAREVHAADIVAKVEVKGLAAQARVADDSTAVLVSFVQERRVDGRVARLWSLERPWEAPVSAPIPDGALQVELSGYGTLPAGRYLAEIAIDDPWVAPLRPARGTPNTAPVQVGHPLEAVERRARLPGGDPLALLERATAGDQLEPQLDGSPLAPVACEAVIALSTLLDQLPPAAPARGGLSLVRALLCADPHVLLRGLVDTIAGGHVAPERVPRIVLRTLGRVRDSEVTVDDGDLLAEVWQVAPCLAACFDVAAAEVDPAAAARCEQHLGWTPGSGAPDPSGGQVSQSEAGRSGEELRQLRRFVGLVPQRELEPETLQVANFEWLLAEKDAFDLDARDEEQLCPSRWLHRYRPLADDNPELLGAYASRALGRHVEARRPPRGTFEWAHFGELVLKAAAHFVGRSEQAKLARPALELALQFAPRLVMHDVLLVLALDLSPTPPLPAC